MRSEHEVAHRSTTDRRTDWRPLVTCCLATFLLLAYTTVVTVSAPVIAQSVDSGFAVSQWIIDVYTLALAALVLAMGSLGDRVGHRQLFLIGLAGFGTASVACAVQQPPAACSSPPAEPRASAAPRSSPRLFRY